jgi:hypothetical protein
MIESSQSLSFRFRQRISASCFVIKAAKSGFVASSSMYEDIDASKEVTKGL